MKLLSLLVCSLISHLSLADGIDRIQVFLNGQLIHASDSYTNETDYTIAVGDTLLFDAWTDWSALEMATLTLSDPKETTQRVLQQERNRQYGAQFIYIVKEGDLEKMFLVILNYNVLDLKPYSFLSIKNGRIE